MGSTPTTTKSAPSPSYWHRLWQGLRLRHKQHRAAASSANAPCCTSVAATRYADRRRAEPDSNNMAAARYVPSSPRLVCTP